METAPPDTAGLDRAAIRSTLFLPWMLVFLAVNLLMPGHGGTNANSRFALMRAMLERSTFRIDAYRDWTSDWARSEQGSYYSNKAPGPALIGAPFLAGIEAALPADRHRTGEPPDSPPARVSDGAKSALSVLLQVLPFLLVAAACIRHAQIRRRSLAAVSFMVLAMLFGNTASVYMNTYFGHGMAANFLTGGALAMLGRRHLLSGLCFGFALLSDYGAALALPPLLVVLAATNRGDLRWVPRLLAGGAIPGALWCWYHVSCFGGPFTLPAVFQNPRYLDLRDVPSLWGTFHPAPRLDNARALLFGSTRGLLVTQPWMLVFIPSTIWCFLRGRQRRLIALGTGTFILLFLLNASFGAWHGGWAVGPRYLCIVFPCIAFAAGMCYDDLTRPVRTALWLGLIASVVFHGQVYVTTVLVPEHVPLWPWQWSRIWQTERVGLPARMLLYCALLVGASLWIRARALRSPPAAGGPGAHR